MLHHHASSSSSCSATVAAVPAPAVEGPNVDRVLFKNLVEMVPLVESLMDRRAGSSYGRRASMVYTPAPAQLRKGRDFGLEKNARSASARKRRDKRDTFGDESDGFSICSTNDAQKDKDELIKLLQEVNDLQKKLLEKEEALKSAEDLLNQMTAASASLEDLRREVAEKDSMVKAANLEMYNAKIMLADNQATLEKLVWETKMSNRKLEELEESLVSKEFEANALMQLFEEAFKTESAAYPDYSFTSSDNLDQYLLANNLDENDLARMEEARIAYMAAVAVAKMNPSEESLAAAAEARVRLQTLVL